MMMTRSRASSGKDFRRIKKSSSSLSANHNSSTSSSDEYSGVCVRSSFSDINVTDLVSFLADVQKFLDRLNHEDLSDDCREIKHSLSCRIDFYTKKSRTDWRSQSNYNLNNRNSIDLKNEEHRFSRSSNIYDNQEYSKSSIPPPLPSSQPPDDNDHGGAPPPLPARKQGPSSSMSMDESSYCDTTTTDSEADYSRTKINNSLHFTPDSPPVKTSTPRKMRNSELFNHNTTESFIEEEEEDFDEEEYDLVEIKSFQNQYDSQSSALDISSRSMTEIADHKGWLWKKESIFKSVRYWALIHQSNLYLYADVQDDVYKESFYLEDAHLKRHKKGVKFLVQVSGTYKNKNSKQEYQTESAEQTDLWIMHLENAIAMAGKTPKTSKKLSFISQGKICFLPVFNYIFTFLFLDGRDKFSSMNDMRDNDEDYDVVEVRKNPVDEVFLLLSKPSSSKTLEDFHNETIYDVPKRKMSLSRMIRKSKSSFNLDRKHTDDDIQFTPKKQPPLPSPRKNFPGALSNPTTPSHDVNHHFFHNNPSVVSKRLFNEDDDNLDHIYQHKISPDFSSKTLKPTKKQSNNESDVRRFRPRNKSESLKQPEEVYNELAMILEKRRQNLESRPFVPERPNNLNLDTKDNFPAYSKVNKVAKLPQKVSPPVVPPGRETIGPLQCSLDQGVGRSQTMEEVKPVQSFLHTFVNSAKYNTSLSTSNNTSNNNSLSPSKGW